LPGTGYRSSEKKEKKHIKELIRSYHYISY
jgi:hypothetical protein